MVRIESISVVFIVWLTLVAMSPVRSYAQGAASCTPPGQNPTRCVNELLESFCNDRNDPFCSLKPWEKLSYGQRWVYAARFCTDNEAHPRCEQFAKLPKPLILRYDHAKTDWVFDSRAAQHHDGVPLADFHIDKDVAGVPTIRISTDTEVLIAVINTNPLLFTTRQGKITETDISGFAELTRLFGLFGGGVATMVSEVAALDARTSPAKEVSEVKKLIEELAQARIEAIAILNAVDKGQVAGAATPLTSPTAAQVNDALTRLRAAVDQLSREIKNNSKRGPDVNCVGHREAARAAFDLPTTEPNRIYLAAVSAEAKRKDCDVVPRLANLKTKAKDAIGSGDTAELREVIRTFFADNHSTLEGQLNRGRSSARALAAGAEILKKQDTIEKSVTELKVFEAKRAENVVFGELDTTIYFAPPEYDRKWTKLNSYAFDVKKDSAYAAKVVSTHREVAATYKIAPRTGQVLGFGVAVIYTGLSSPSFGLRATEDDPEVKVVTRTGEETRAGELVAFGNLRWLQLLRPSTQDFFLRPGVEFGVGLNQDYLSFYTGVSFELWKVVRLGVGNSWQQVTVLDGQEAGVTVLPAADHIKTKNEFTNRLYFSLTIAFDGLSLFQSS